MNTTHLDFNSVVELEQQNTINLLKIQLPDGRQICICDSFKMDYVGDTYDYLEFTLSGDKESQTGERNRPVLDITNPDAFLNKLALSGDLLGSLVTRYQLEATYNSDVAVQLVRSNRWKIYQLTGLSTNVVFQMRTLTDSAGRSIPPRQYFPPIFNHVNV